MAMFSLTEGNVRLGMVRKHKTGFSFCVVNGRGWGLILSWPTFQRCEWKGLLCCQSEFFFEHNCSKILLPRSWLLPKQYLGMWPDLTCNRNQMEKCKSGGSGAVVLKSPFLLGQREQYQLIAYPKLNCCLMVRDKMLLLIPQSRCSWCLNLGVDAAKAQGVFVVCPPPPHLCEHHNWRYQLLFVWVGIKIHWTEEHLLLTEILREVIIFGNTLLSLSLFSLFQLIFLQSLPLSRDCS